MNKQELIYFCNVLKENKSRFINCIDVDRIIDAIKQLDEPEKVKVPQFVADWIEYFKKYSGSLYGSTAPYSYYGHAITDDFVGDVKKTLGWIRNNSETYARAWLDGYDVEEEKRYTVVMEATKQPLYYNAGDKKLFFSTGGLATNFTQKQLEAAGFGWVFSCEGINIKEVEE